MRRKAIDDLMCAGNDKPKTLGLFDLTIMGVGAIIGTGILVLTGIVAATDAGPGVVFSFLIAALASALIGLCYSELTTTIPSSGSAYVYSWITMGEQIAFFSGWTLLGVYITTTATVANGWTGYVASFLREIGINLPHSLTQSPFTGGLVNLPAVLIVLLITLLLTRGMSESKVVNNVLVLVKIGIIILFVIVGAFSVKSSNWKPFLPYGVKGIFTGASTVFFSFLGFDALATSAEDCKHVQKNLPIAIIASLTISTVLYIIVSLVMTGDVQYNLLNVPEAMSFVLITIKHPIVAQIVSAGAILGILAVILAFIYASSNIAMSMSRGGFLPPIFSKLNSKTQTPNRSLWLIGITTAVCAGFLDIKNLATFANVGSLCIFFIISLAVLLLRKQHPELKRSFKVPFGVVIPILSALVCLLLLFNLPASAWIKYIGWLAIGLVLYFAYSKSHVIY
ncbi:APC family permease [Companilactobacillus mishanensis]|uniref:Amino acid permease n=1 Tax=Companilactobacillus mishanensis TaxID=2486008 RepID=A0ABW9P4N7_9LACO|nr:amino acid permease [Companilactobacillus mishanensis]MQS43912.1 amino acid permease [Companilactobacillus mishanensis]